MTNLLLALFVLAAHAAPLTPQNFRDSIAQGVWFIEHFSPYCRHCRAFEPTWNDVVAHFDGLADPGIHLAQVNCALNGDLCNENGITGYPQMNLYRNGELVETYNADRTFETLVDYLREHAAPSATTQEEEPLPSTTTEEEEPTPTPTPTPPVELVVQVPRSEPNPSGTVVPLDVQTFDSFLAQGPVFVKFFAPWCGHCKKLAPTWSMLGRRMQHRLSIAEVDCEQHKALCTSQGVTGFPMMFYYANGVKTEYTGGRSYDQLVSFADKASSPSMQAVQTLPELEQVVRDNAVVYLLLHDPSDQRIVTDIAKSSQFLLGSPPVYVSSSPDLFRRYKLPPNTPSALLAFKDRDAREPASMFSLPSSESTQDLKAWLSINRFPSSFELSKDIFQQVMYAPHKPLVVIVATPKGQEETVSDKLQEIAQKWRLRTHATAGARDVLFTWMDASQWSKWLKDMYGIKAKTGPEIVVADHEHLLYYNKDGSGHAILLNSVSIASAIEAVLAGTARPNYSQSFIERAVYYLNAKLMWTQEAIVKHPYWTALTIIGLIGAVIAAVWRVLKDDPVEWEVEKRYAKRGRLD